LKGVGGGRWEGGDEGREGCRIAGERVRMDGREGGSWREGGWTVGGSEVDEGMSDCQGMGWLGSVVARSQCLGAFRRCLVVAWWVEIPYCLSLALLLSYSSCGSSPRVRSS
jgi:hypothetical protein